MVKRVKDMTQNPDDVSSADASKVVKEVKEIASVINISNDSDENKRPTGKQVVVNVCPLCEMGVDPDDINFYNIALLKKFLSVRGKIIPRSKTGLCSRHQRAVTRAIKRARYVALLPYVNVGV